jgi:hypothetical protein
MKRLVFANLMMIKDMAVGKSLKELNLDIIELSRF